MASTLITTAALASHIETTLKEADNELERLIDSADSAIRDVYGPHVDGERTVKISTVGYYDVFLPYPPAESVSEVKDYLDNELSSESVVIPSTEYELEEGGWSIRRPAKRFRDRVVVTYTPVDDTADRIHMLIDLVRLADQYEAIKIEEVGGGQSSGVTNEHLDYQKEWRAILNRMRPMAPGAMFV